MADALPYIDREYEAPEYKARVDAMIQAELRSMPQSEDRTSNYPNLTLFKKHPALKEEYARVEAKQTLAGLDTSRYKLEAPGKDKENDVAAWREAYHHSCAQLQHQDLRLVNLELMQKYGSNAWLYHNFQVEHMAGRVEAQTQENRDKALEINRARKIQQLKAGETLGLLAVQLRELQESNAQAETAVRRLEREAEQQRTSASS
ncbi:hypothetical protein RI367_005131 [Sorochytrium milnesiophthora]